MTTIKRWQVLGFGEGFERSGSKMGFELSGYINAANPDEAFFKAISIVKADFPEIEQAAAKEFRKSVINAEEIYEVGEPSNSETDRIEVHWYAE